MSSFDHSTLIKNINDNLSPLRKAQPDALQGFGQLAKALGCRAVGIAGGVDKCEFVVRELGFDACIDYKRLDGTAAIASALKEHAPSGIDGYFENVGGAILDAVMLNANAFSRIAMCGMISGYNGAPILSGFNRRSAIGPFAGGVGSPGN